MNILKPRSLLVEHLLKIACAIAIVYLVKYVEYFLGATYISNMMDCFPINECSSCRTGTSSADYLALIMYPIFVVLLNLKNYKNLLQAKKSQLFFILALYLIPIIPFIFNELNLNEKFCLLLHPTPKSYLLKDQ